MAKKAILCLFLMFVFMLSSCSVPILPKKEAFYPQSNVVEYVLDTSIKQFPQKNLENRKIFFLGIETEMLSDETLKDFSDYFVSSFENNVQKFVLAEEADTVLYVELGMDIVVKNNDFQEDKTPRKAIGKQVVLMTSVPFDKLREEFSITSRYKFQEKKEMIRVSSLIVVIDLKTEEILYYDEAICASIYDSANFKKQ